MDEYIYEGPVFVFGKCVADRWRGITRAVNKDKALSNLKFQARRHLNLGLNASVALPGTIRLYKERKGA